MKWLHKIIYSFSKENDKQEKMDEAQDKFSPCQLALSLVKVAVQLSQSNMSCAYCLKASHSVRLNGKG